MLEDLKFSLFKFISKHEADQTILIAVEFALEGREFCNISK